MERRLRNTRRYDDEAPGVPQPRTTSSGRRTSSTLGQTAPMPTKRARASPTRTKATGAPPAPKPTTPELGPRTRRSSRPRSAASNAIPTSTTIKIQTPIKEVRETPSPTPRESTNNLPTTLTTNTSTRAPNKSFLTSSVYSSYSSTTTTEHIEVRRDGEVIDKESIEKRVVDRLRRSLSKTIANIAGTERTHTPTTNTEETGSRYSRSVSRSIYEDDEKSSKHSYSDVEDDDVLGNTSVFCSFNGSRQTATPTNVACRKMEAPREFGGWLGVTLLLLLTPAVVYYLTWSCAGVRNACAFKRLNLAVLLDGNYLARQVFKPGVVAAYSAYQVLVFVLVALLPGRRVHLTRETYKFNALSVGLTLLIAIAIGEYLKYDVVSFILRHYLRFCIFGCASAFVAAAWSYWRIDNKKYNVLCQTQANEYGRTGNFLVDYALGRQLNPKWMGRVDLKQFYYRLSLVSTLIYAACYIYQTVQWPSWPKGSSDDYMYLARYYYRNVSYDSGTLVVAGLLLLYLLDAIVFEHHLSSSFELQHEGYGCLLLLRYAATPYLLSAVSKYFYEQRIPISCGLAPYGAFALMLLGLFIKRASCAYKYKYRLNSQHPMFANIDTIHTYQGSRLLLGFFWGRLRQPNYLGDIIALSALGVLLFLRFAWPPLLALLLLVVLLLHRAKRTNARNQTRYHSSWHRYCANVRYYVLPKVY